MKFGKPKFEKEKFDKKEFDEENLIMKRSKKRKPQKMMREKTATMKIVRRQGHMKKRITAVALRKKRMIRI